MIVRPKSLKIRERSRCISVAGPPHAPASAIGVLRSGGTSTFRVPTGGADQRPPLDADVTGNMLCSVGNPVAESTARSGRYSKMWDLPCWKSLATQPATVSKERSQPLFPCGRDGDCLSYLGPGRVGVEPRPLVSSILVNMLLDVFLGSLPHHLTGLDGAGLGFDNPFMHPR